MADKKGKGKQPARPQEVPRISGINQDADESDVQNIKRLIHNDTILQLEDAIIEAQEAYDNLINEIKRNIIKEDPKKDPNAYTDELDIAEKEIALNKEISNRPDVGQLRKNLNDANKKLIDFLKRRIDVIMNELTDINKKHENKLLQIKKRLQNATTKEEKNEYKKEIKDFKNKHAKRTKWHKKALITLNELIQSSIMEKYENDPDKAPYIIGLEREYELFSPRDVKGTGIKLDVESRTAQEEQLNTLLQLAKDEEERIFKELLNNYSSFNPLRKRNALKELKKRRDEIFQRVMHEYGKTLEFNTSTMRRGAQVMPSDPMVRGEMQRLEKEKLPKNPTPKQIEDAINYLNEREKEMKLKIEKYEKREQNLNVRISKLNQREAELQKRESELNKDKQFVAGEEARVAHQKKIYEAETDKDIQKRINELVNENEKLNQQLEKNRQTTQKTSDTVGKWKEEAEKCKRQLAEVRLMYERCVREANKMRKQLGTEESIFDAIINWFKNLFSDEEEKPKQGTSGTQSKRNTGKTGGGSQSEDNLHDKIAELEYYLGKVGEEMRGGKRGRSQSKSSKRRSRSRSKSSKRRSRRSRATGSHDSVGLETLLGYYQGPQSLYKQALKSELQSIKKPRRRTRSKSRKRSRSKSRRGRKSVRRSRYSKQMMPPMFGMPQQGRKEFLPGILI